MARVDVQSMIYTSDGVRATLRDSCSVRKVVRIEPHCDSDSTL